MEGGFIVRFRFFFNAKTQRLEGGKWHRWRRSIGWHPSGVRLLSWAFSGGVARASLYHAATGCEAFGFGANRECVRGSRERSRRAESRAGDPEIENKTENRNVAERHRLPEEARKGDAGERQQSGNGKG